MRAATLLVLASALGGTLVAQQGLPRDPLKSSAVRTASVTGRVTDRDTGQPLRRMVVRLTLRGREALIFHTTTNAEGRYELTALPPGEYHAAAGPDEFGAGYLGKNFGVDEAVSPSFLLPPPLVLKPDETRRDVDFALARTFAIDGRVLNEYGEPMAGVTVFGERVDRLGGTRNVTTDDRGLFRLFDVVAGSWRVCGTAEGIGGVDNPTSGNVLQARFTKTCYPAATASAGSSAVAVKASDVGGVVIQMQRERAYTLSGYVVDESGSAVEQASLTVERENRRTTAGSPEFQRGAFIVRGLTPGGYVIRAVVEEAGDPYAPFPPYVGPRELGFATVRIDASDVSGIVVTMTRGAEVSGRIVFDGDSQPPVRASSLRVYTIRRAETNRIYNNSPTGGAVKDDFTFEFTHLRGPVTFAVSGSPEGWILKSARLADLDITETPTEFKPGRDPRIVELTLTNRTAMLMARPVDESGQPSSRAAILLGPSDPARWKVGAVYPIPPNADGTVSIPPRRPGDYLIAAVLAEDVARGRLRNNDDLKAIADRAQRISLKEGDQRAVDVRIVRLPDGR